MNKTEQSELKTILKHYIDLEYYANSVDKDITDLYEELNEDCFQIIENQDSYNTKNAYNTVKTLLNERISDFGTRLNDKLETEAENIKNVELDFLSTMYKSYLTIGAVKLSRLLFTPIDGKDTAKTFAERTQKNIFRSYDNATRAGYIFGQSSDDIKSQIKKNLVQVKNGMNNGIKTAIPSFAKQTDRIVFLQNEIETVWVSVLDGNQCIVCSFLNGTHYKSPSLVPTYPAHNNCRCVLMPAKSVTTEIPKYQEYIESLTDKEQQHILGKNRYEMYKSGNVTLNQFINNGRLLRLDELK